MRSIQYEKTEEKTKGDTAGRKGGIKESNKVGAKKKSVCDAEKEGEIDEKKVKDMKFICEMKTVPQQRR